MAAAATANIIMGNMLKSFLVIFILWGLIVPLFSFANGGDQRVLGSEYLVNLVRSPFTPIADTKTSMVVSFVDLKTGTLIQDDLLVTVRVGKGRGSKTFIHEEKELPVEGGILEWQYTFANHGIHELFFNFAFASDPQTIYEPPDFLLDVQRLESPTNNNALISISAITMLIGGVVGWLIGRRKTL